MLQKDGSSAGSVRGFSPAFRASENCRSNTYSRDDDTLAKSTPQISATPALYSRSAARKLPALNSAVPAALCSSAATLAASFSFGSPSPATCSQEPVVSSLVPMGN